MKRRFKASLTVLLAVLFVTGCSSRIGDFTTVSTKNVNMNAEYQKVGSTEGSDGAVLIGQPDLKTAVDNALENAGSDTRYLTNARIIGTSYPFYSKITVEGDAWKPVSGADAEGEVYRLEKTKKGKFLISEDGSEKIEVFESVQAGSEAIDSESR
ncbi:hypothetical protein [Salinibacter ruber]|jgi:hypothetical protein|uniref:Lipoprotein n=2 Tax=Salinibacter ruber TaxID=146919 RepID=A0A9X2PT61_9BACT|nr:hypothetical protein [Salinibacter ruber]MBB4088244.1 hypothetical protein [Salinibacter ruber]MCS3611841.1 hypothetical protein [Salinibacter ruber]MCS3615854.1 hypothetical protein [Salinibacter ruber]MCS3639914.1 hypothetical protein [Salinibacter ruber]MCS3646386.1 hypothetical protein [Salinibacter ruber]